MKPLRWQLIPFFMFIVLAILFWRGLKLDPHHLPSAKIGKPMPAFDINTLDNQHLTADHFRGKVSLLNIWASWCMACADEQLFLMKLANQGTTIYGLNYKDTPDEATRWLAEWGNPYQQVGADVDGKVAINMGVYGAPETFLIDKDGVIQYRHVGPLTLAVWEQVFVPRIQALEAVA